jgi:hypothetical protein
MSAHPAPPRSSVEQQRGVEGSALAIRIERYPDFLTLAELIELVNEPVSLKRRPGRAAAIEQAVKSLAGVGLLELRGVLLMPTPAALRVGELELSL